MRGFYHIADPDFWVLWRERGRFAFMDHAPNLGECELRIRFSDSDESVLVSGGMITRVAQIASAPDCVVEVLMTNVTEPLQVVLPEGIEIKDRGAQDEVQVVIVHRDSNRPDHGRLQIYFQYFWREPSVVRMSISEEKPNPHDSGWVDEYASGTVTVDELRRMVKSRRVPTRKARGTRNRRQEIVFSVMDYCSTYAAMQALGELVLHGVTPARFIEAAIDLLRFAEFAQADLPPPEGQVQGDAA